MSPTCCEFRLVPMSPTYCELRLVPMSSICCEFRVVPISPTCETLTQDSSESDQFVCGPLPLKRLKMFV